jgi:hypothetical protein
MGDDLSVLVRRESRLQSDRSSSSDDEQARGRLAHNETAASALEPSLLVAPERMTVTK